MDRLFLWISRAAFAALIGFELLNYFHILHFTLEFTWLGLVSTSVAALATLEIVNAISLRRWHIDLHWASWPLLLCSVLADAMGDWNHFYARFAWYDQSLHFLNSFVVAGIILGFLVRIRNYSRKRFESVELLLAFHFAVFCGVLYEIDEYLEDLFNHTYRLGDGYDTANDLLLDVLGSFTLIAIVWVYRKIRAHYRKK